MTGDEPQGTMGRVQTPVVSFPPSFARTFSSKERRLGTRQPLSSDRTTENEKNGLSEHKERAEKSWLASFLATNLQEKLCSFL